jgi:hypothetical protein
MALAHDACGRYEGKSALPEAEKNNMKPQSGYPVSRDTLRYDVRCLFYLYYGNLSVFWFVNNKIE